MRFYYLNLLVIVACVALMSNGSFALAASSTAAATASPVMLVVDTSGSMSEDDGSGQVKIEGAKLALLDFLQSVEQQTPMGLHTYPDQSSGTDCNDGITRIPVEPRNPTEMSAEIRQLDADGDTPTAEALRAAVDELNDKYSNGTLVLVSDGKSTCEPPCDTAKEIAESGFDIEAITVGFRISDSGREELECIANALDGEYIDADDNAALGETLDRLSRPDLEIRVPGYPYDDVVAEAGTDGTGAVKITATITNNGERQADDVVARLRFGKLAPGVAHPVQRIGNLAPGSTSREIQWTFYPGAALRGKDLEFTITASARNSTTDQIFTGTIGIIDLTTAEKAATVLAGKSRIAIMGDSYSSGEGAEDYIDNTDSDRNACHRSAATYLVKTFGIPNKNILACSGAVATHVSAPDEKNGVASQISQLARLYDNHPGQVQAVIMTMGGNDYKFPTVAKSCLFPFNSCAETMYPNLPWPITETADSFVSGTLGNDATKNALSEAYDDINGIVNSVSAVKERKAIAPILVLGYPLPIPLSGRSCLPMVNLDRKEILWVGSFALRLNGIIEGVTRKAREDGVPIFYVPNTELSFQPNHTVCDGDPYARALNSVNGAGVTPSVIARAFHPSTSASAVGQVLQRSSQELVHPNSNGYLAETYAIIRWSRSPAGKLAEAYVANAKPAKPPKLSWKASEVDLGQLTGTGRPDLPPGFQLQGGTTYPLTVGGYKPGSTTQITIHSDPLKLGEAEVDETGTVATRVAIPRFLEPGAHTIYLSGVDANGKSRIVPIPVEVAGSQKPDGGVLIAAAGASTLLFALLFWMIAAVARRRADARDATPLRRGHGHRGSEQRAGRAV